MESLTTILFEAHSGVRWLVTAASVLLILYLLYALVRGDASLKNQRFVQIWVGLFDLQAALGLLVLLLMGFNARHRIEHAVMMIIAVVVAHMSARWKSAETPLWARNTLIVALAALALVFVGVWRLPQGWMG